MGVDHGRRVRWPPGQLMMVGDDDRHAALPGRGDLGVARGARIGGEQQRPTLADRHVHRAQRQAVSLLGTVRHVRRHVQAQLAEGEDEDGEPGQPIGVEVPQDEDAFLRTNGLADAGECSIGVGQQSWIQQGGRRFIEACRDARRIDGSTPREHAHRPGRRVPAPARRRPSPG